MSVENCGRLPKLLLKDGKTPSRYGLACGYLDRFERDNDNRVTLQADGNVYAVKGFERGAHFWQTFDYNNLSQARKFFRCVRSRMRSQRNGKDN